MTDYTPSEDRDVRVQQLAGALLVAMARANGVVSAEICTLIADQLDTLGVRLTGEIDTDALAEVPAFVRDGAREKSVSVPVEPDHMGVQDTPRVRRAPKMPKRIPKANRGVVG